MKAIRLCDICDFQGGAQPPKNQWIDERREGYVRMLQIRDFTQIEKVKPEFVKISARVKMCKEDDILIARYGASVGKILTGLSGAYNVAIMKTIPDEKKISKKYLFYFLSSEYFQKFIMNVGSRAAQAGFNKDDLQNVMLIERTLEEQQVTCKVLDKITELITNRKTELRLLDKCVKSRFVELFGQPDRNPFGWDVYAIGTLVSSCDAGWSGNGTQRKKKAGEVAVLKVSAVTKGYFVPSESKVLDNQDYIKKYVFPQAGDLLFSRANTREMVGATAVITRDYPEHILPDKLWKIRFVDAANVWYMKYVLSYESIRSIFSSVSTGTSGSMFNVSMKKFKSIKIPLPPIELQEQFAAFVEQVDKSKLAVQKSLDELETLKKSLMQQYFG